MRDHEVVADASDLKPVRPAHHRSMGVAVELAGLNAHALERTVGGDAVKPQRLVEAETRHIAALTGPERQRLVEHPAAEPRRRRSTNRAGLSLRSNSGLARCRITQIHPERQFLWGLIPQVIAREIPAPLSLNQIKLSDLTITSLAPVSRTP